MCWRPDAVSSKKLCANEQTLSKEHEMFRQATDNKIKYSWIKLLARLNSYVALGWVYLVQFDTLKQFQYTGPKESLCKGI